MQAFFGNGFALPEISPFRAGCPQPERRNHVYCQYLAQAFEAPPREGFRPCAGSSRTTATPASAFKPMCMAWNAKQKQEGQHQGPITAAYQRVLHALLWHFMSYRDGLCFPSYETIAEKARCCRDTVYEAILALEQTGVFSWVNRIDRVAERGKDLFGQWMTSYRIVRRSNVYEFRDPLPCAEALNPFGNLLSTEKPTGHEIQELPSSLPPPKIIILDPDNPLDAALIRFGKTLKAI